MKSKALIQLGKFIRFSYQDIMARVGVSRKLLIKLVTSYCIITLLGASIALWLHTERDVLWAEQERQELQNNGEAVVVASPAYTLITATASEDTGESHLKDILVQVVAGKALTIVAMEEQSSKEGSMLNVEVCGKLQEYFMLITELAERHPNWCITPKQVKKENGQLHISFTVKDR